MATVVTEVQDDNKEVKLDATEASQGKSFIDELESDEEETGKDGEGDGKGKEGEEGKEKGGSEEVGKEGADGKEGEEGKEGADKGEQKPVPDEKDEEIRNLRQISRDQKRELDKVTQALEKTNKLLKDANLVSPEEEEKDKAVEEFRARREEQLENLLEVMRVTDKYGDVDDVVSQEHFDDMIEAMARAYVAEKGGKLEDVIKGVEAEVWATKNPYKLMYDNIKRYHPDYKAAPAKGDGEGKDEDDKEKSGKGGKEKGKGLDIEKIASSIHEVGGGSSGTGGWTAARIDELDELELDQVPKDIYDKYLKGELK
jgi:hypothetical protein